MDTPLDCTACVFEQELPISPRFAAAEAVSQFDRLDSPWTSCSQIARQLELPDSTLRYWLRNRHLGWREAAERPQRRVPAYSSLSAYTRLASTHKEQPASSQKRSSPETLELGNQGAGTDGFGESLASGFRAADNSYLASPCANIRKVEFGESSTTRR